MALKPPTIRASCSLRIAGSRYTRSHTFVQGVRCFRQQASPRVLKLTSLASESLSNRSITAETPYNLRIQRMSSKQRDVSHLADISKSKMAEDGSYNRKPSTFRDVIEKGGKYEPEKGGLDSEGSRLGFLTCCRTIPPLRLLRVSLGPSNSHYAYHQGPGGVYRRHCRLSAYGEPWMAIRQGRRLPWCG
jgi:hypothetical protein